jgi:signal transduction histidine kinase
MSDARPSDGASPEPRGPGPRPADGRTADARPLRRPTVPRSFQTRLTISFLAVVALTLALVALVVVNRLDDYFRQQEEESLRVRAAATAAILDRFIEDEVGTQAVVVRMPDGTLALNPKVEALLVHEQLLALAAGNVAQADIRLEFGAAHTDTDGTPVVDPDPHLAFVATLDAKPGRGQARDPAISPSAATLPRYNDRGDWGLAVTLSNPYTSRASTLAAITGLLVVMASLAFFVAVLVAAFLAHRFTTPLTRLTEASRRLAEGDLSSRVPTDEVSSSTLELRELSQQFNTMADRLEQSVAIIRRDRDYSRDFLADVSHELRTPIAATRTFIELLQGPAGRDPAARAEFLDSSAVQLDRLDWLAQNLLELSKLDSGLVLLDLRPDDVRATIESAVEQQQAAAERKGIRLTASLPDRPLRIRHDPPRVGQIVSNLVGNAVKFTDRDGSVRVSAAQLPDGGARIEVADTGVGIVPAELPLIFDRFYRGSGANEARGTGSGLGLAIVKSIVDMHHGTIEVESRVGVGSRFVVTLPRDPREAAEVPAASPGEPATREPVTPDEPAAAAPVAPDARIAKVDDSSSGADPTLNRDPAPLIPVPDRHATDQQDQRERRPPRT